MPETSSNFKQCLVENTKSSDFKIKIRVNNFV